MSIYFIRLDVKPTAVLSTGYDIVATEDGYLIVGDQKSRLSRDSNVWLLKVNSKGRLR